MFDLLTYQKGGSVLRMLEQYLGKERFQEGIRFYLDRHKYDNTETSDLWEAIESITGEPARRIMDSWIFQGGFPMITVSSHGDGSKLTLRQQRFRYTPGIGGEDPLWSVPIVLRYSVNGEERERRELLEKSSTEVDLGASADRVIVNAGGNGFYRVAYAPEWLQKITPRMRVELEPIERYGLVDDTWASVLSGAASAVDFLEFAKEFEAEDDLDVWTVLSGCLDQLDRLLDREVWERYHRLLRDLYRPVLDRLGWERRESDSPRALELRGLLIRVLAVTVKDPDVIPKCRRLHGAYLADSSAVEPNVAAGVAAAVAANGTPGDYGVFLSRFKNAATPQEERRYQFLLAGFPGAAEMNCTLEMTLNGEVRTQDAPYLIAQCLMNRAQGRRAWEFVRDHWDEMLKAYPDNAIVRML